MGEPRCDACGASLNGVASCIDHFHVLLAAEVESEELRRMHGLTVLTYYLQHPALTKAWYQRFAAGVMQRVCEQGEAWEDVLLETHPHGIGRRADAAVARLKAAGGTEMPGWVVAHPIAGELTVTSIDPAAASGQAARIEQWARSVAEHRVLGKMDETATESTPTA